MKKNDFRFQIIDRMGVIVAVAMTKKDAIYCAVKRNAKHIYDRQAKKYIPFPDEGEWLDLPF